MAGPWHSGLGYSRSQRASRAIFQLGAIGATPAGQGIVEGGEIPYRPAAAAQQKENFKNRMKLDPEVKCYMPGIPRANYMPFPFQIIQSQRDVAFAYEFATANRVVNMQISASVVAEESFLRDTLLPAIRPMVTEGLILLLDVEVVP